MKKLFMRVLAGALGVSMLFSGSVFAVGTDASKANSENISVSEMRNYLLEEAIPEEYLSTQSDEEINTIYDDMKSGNTSYHVTTETTYLYETAEGLRPTANISEAHMTLKISAGDYYDSTTGKVNRTDVHVEYTWLGARPNLRGTDAISVNWDPSVYTYTGSFVSKEYANLTKQNDLYYQSTRPSELVQGGLGYFVHLTQTYDKASGTQATGVHGTGYFTLTPKNPLYRATSSNASTVTGIQVNYVHSEDITGLFPLSFSVSGVGVAISTSGNCSKAAKETTMYYK